MIKINSRESNIWVSSDIHGLHKNICYGTSSWDDKESSTRMFDNPNQMTDHLIDQINKYVKTTDVLFLLGDLLFHYKDVDSYKRFIMRINCLEIFMCYGNHCHRDNLNKAIEELNYESDKLISIQDYMEVQIDGRLICMMHYPIHEWNNRHKASYMLHGHSHGKWDDDQPKGRLDVGMDTAFKIFGEYRPFSWNEIKEILG